MYLKRRTSTRTVPGEILVHDREHLKSWSREIDLSTNSISHNKSWLFLVNMENMDPKQPNRTISSKIIGVVLFVRSERVLLSAILSFTHKPPAPWVTSYLTRAITTFNVWVTFGWPVILCVIHHVANKMALKFWADISGRAKWFKC